MTEEEGRNGEREESGNCRVTDRMRKRERDQIKATVENWS